MYPKSDETTINSTGHWTIIFEPQSYNSYDIIVIQRKYRLTTSFVELYAHFHFSCYDSLGRIVQMFVMP